MLGVVRRFQLTIVLLVILLVVAIGTRTHFAPLAPSLRRGLGFAPWHLLHGKWLGLFTSVFLTIGGATFYASMIMLALSVGAAESVYGSSTALALFWGCHLTTLLAASLLLAIPLHQMNYYPGTVLVTASDVGPSAGYYGCLAAACVALKGKKRNFAVLAILALLGLRLVRSLVQLPEQGHLLSADLAHVIAFTLGASAALYLLPRGWLALAKTDESGTL